MKRSSGEKGIQLLQQESGYRSSLDPFLLASRQEKPQLVGLEIQLELAALANRNVVLNELKGQVQIDQGDIREVFSLFARGSFDAVVGNPPYRKLRDGRLNPEPAKAMARHEVKLTLKEFLTSVQYLLKDKGRLAIIYHPGRLVELLTQMEQLRIRPQRLRFVHSARHSPATMVLVEGIKAGRGKTEIMPPLIIYRQPQVYSLEMERIFSEASKRAKTSLGSFERKSPVHRKRRRGGKSLRHPKI